MKTRLPALISLLSLGVATPANADPVLSVQTRLLASNGESEDYFGQAVSGAGDLNGDGYDDVLVGAPEEGLRAGAVYVYTGSVHGVDVASEYKLEANFEDAADYFGCSVSAAGDIDGDGFADIVVGAFGDDELGESAGTAFVYLGSTTGVDPTSEAKLLAFDGDDHDYFGSRVAGAGDVNGDGFDDVIAGAMGNNDAGLYAGAAYLYLGSGDGIDRDTEQKLVPSASDQAGRFGSDVSGAGDVNGDGFDDLVIGAYMDDQEAESAGAAYVVLGSAAGVDPSTETRLSSSNAHYWERFGHRVSGAGDINADGYADVIVGTDDDGPDGISFPSAYVYLGGASGVDAANAMDLNAPDASFSDWFGVAVASVGDVDDDGYDDVLVGSFRDSFRGSSAGSVYVFFGSPDGPATPFAEEAQATDGTSRDYFGWAVAGAGDVDGDGLPDALVGPYGHDDLGSDAGAAYVLSHCQADADGDGTCAPVDCDDEDASLGAASIWHQDADDDGLGDPEETTTACDQPSGYVAPTTATTATTRTRRSAPPRPGTAMRTPTTGATPTTSPARPAASPQEATSLPLATATTSTIGSTPTPTTTAETA